MFYKSNNLCHTPQPRLDRHRVGFAQGYPCAKATNQVVLRVRGVLMKLSLMQRAVQVPPAVVRREAPNRFYQPMGEFGVMRGLETCDGLYWWDENYDKTIRRQYYGGFRTICLRIPGMLFLAMQHEMGTTLEDLVLMMIN